MRRGDLGRLVDDLARLDFDDADGVVLDALEPCRATARVAADGVEGHGDGGRQDACDDADHERSTGERPASSGSGRDEFVLLALVGRRGVAGAQRREFRRQALDVELVDAFEALEILEPKIAEIPKHYPGWCIVVEHRRRRGRGEDLAAVAGGHDARRAVHAEAVVALLGEDQLAGVQSHAHPQLAILRPVVSLQRALPVRGRGCGVPRPREDVEERVALCVHLGPAMHGEHLVQQPPVIGQHRRIAVAELLHEPRRSLDVREQERHSDRAGLGHRGSKHVVPAQVKHPPGGASM